MRRLCLPRPIALCSFPSVGANHKTIILGLLLGTLLFSPAEASFLKSCLYALGLQRHPVTHAEWDHAKIRVLRLRLRHTLQQIHIQRNTSHASPYFREREEIRYFLQKHFGETWLLEGKMLLEALRHDVEQRAFWDEAEKQLADGTFLFLIHESKLDFEELTDLDNDAYALELQVQRDEIAVELMWFRRAKENNPDLTKFKNDNSHLRRSRERLSQHHEIMKKVSKRLEIYRELATALMKNSEYHKANIALAQAELFAHDYRQAFWTALGYERVPELEY